MSQESTALDRKMAWESYIDSVGGTFQAKELSKRELALMKDAFFHAYHDGLKAAENPLRNDPKQNQEIGRPAVV